MSSDADQSTSASKPHVSSPLANPPKFPPPPSQNVSPIRRALHERSNSNSNQHAGPTIRMVEDLEDPGTNVYSTTPFPSLPSQILPPRKRPGYMFEGRGARVSDVASVANAVAKIEASQTLVPKPLQQRRASRYSTSTSNSDADTIVASSSIFTPLSSTFSQPSTPSSSIFPDDTALEILEEESPPPEEHSTIRAVPPSTASSLGSLEDDAGHADHALTPRASAVSLASSTSADSVSLPDNEPSSPGNYQIISKGHKHKRSSESNKRKQSSSTKTATRHPFLARASSESFAYSSSDISRSSSGNSDRQRSTSQPSPTIHAAHHVTLSSGVRIHYPIVRPPSASFLRAESHKLPKNPSRMNPRTPQVNQWSSQLSTIPSESERASRSIDRRSQSVDVPSHSLSHSPSHSPDGYATTGRPVARRRQTISSGSASSDNVSSNVTEATLPSVVIPLPLFSPVSQPSNDRNSDELHDTISPLQSPPLRNKRSFLRRHDSNSDSRSTSSRPGSAQSDLSTFITNTIPAWARVYYTRGERISAGAESSTEYTESRIHTATSGRTGTPSDTNYPFSIYRPRNRPHHRVSNPDLMSLYDAPEEQVVYAMGPPPRRPVSEMFTPRLRQDRRSQARLSAWKSPSLDENLGTLIFSRQNRQLLLFCLGFLCPFAWMVAAFLPLPPNPDLVVEPTPSQADLEIQFTRELGPVDDRSYQKAHWWRNLNRIMSAIGTLLVGVIIVVAIFASRMS